MGTPAWKKTQNYLCFIPAFDLTEMLLRTLQTVAYLAAEKCSLPTCSSNLTPTPPTAAS